MYASLAESLLRRPIDIDDYTSRNGPLRNRQSARWFMAVDSTERSLDNPVVGARPAPHHEASLCQPLIFGVLAGASR